jgi:hypothetical protein
LLEVLEALGKATLMVAVVALMWWMSQWPGRVARRNREEYAAHPERRPYGRRLALRASPFIAGLVAVGIFEMVNGQPVLGAIGVLVAVGMIYEVVQRWRPPAGRPDRTRVDAWLHDHPPALFLLFIATVLILAIIQFQFAS